MTYHSTLVPNLDDSGLNLSKLDAPSQYNLNSKSSFDFDPDERLNAHFRLAALRSLLRNYQEDVAKLVKDDTNEKTVFAPDHIHHTDKFELAGTV